MPVIAVIHFTDLGDPATSHLAMIRESVFLEVFFLSFFFLSLFLSARPLWWPIAPSLAAHSWNALTTTKPHDDWSVSWLSFPPAVGLTLDWFH